MQSPSTTGKNEKHKTSHSVNKALNNIPFSASHMHRVSACEEARANIVLIKHYSPQTKSPQNP